MNYKVLYRKYRPSNFDELVGQSKTKELLRESIINEKIAHAYIFSGPRGTGKTSSAKIFAKSINCLNPVNGNPCGECENCKNFATSSDIYEIDAASNNGVDQIRELIDNIKLSPISMKYKVYIIDEVHMLSTSAFNALLLTLEEPPAHVVFILATTDIEDVPITVLSRCQRLEYRKISKNDIIGNLKKISELEQIDISDEALNEIAVYADGGMRDALSVLDQMSKENKRIEAEDILNNIGMISTQNIKKLLDMIESNDVEGITKFIDGCNENAYDIKTLVKKIITEIKQREVLIKSGEFSSNLSYSEYKKLAFELSDLICKINVNIDSFVMLELILLDYVKTGINTGIVEKIDSVKVEEKIPEKVLEKSETIEEKIPEKSVENLLEIKEEKTAENFLQNEIIINEKSTDENYINKLIDARVNNAFVGATRTLKLENVKVWKNYILHETSRKIKGMLSDTEVALSSKEYMVLVHPYEDNANIINNNLDTVENLFNTFNSSNYKLIAVSIRRWKQEEDKFKENLSKKIKYEYMEEPSKEETLELNDVFQNAKIEII